MINDIGKLALQQLSDYRNNNPGTCFDDLNFIIDANSAYELQDKVTELRVGEGEDVIGYKVGCTGSGTIRQFGMEGPIRGALSLMKCWKTRLNWTLIRLPISLLKERWL